MSTTRSLYRNSAPARGVLLVCPDPHKLGVLAGTLHQAGILSLTAQNAENAWECVKTGTVSVVVAELSLITADALYLIHAVRSSKRFHQIPFLLLAPAANLFSRLTSEEEMITPDGWLQIPTASREFVSAVRKLLDEVEKREEEARKKEKEKSAAARAAGYAEADEEQRTTAQALRGIEGVEVVEEEKLRTAGRKTTMIEPDTSSVFSGRLEAMDVTKILGMIEPLSLTGCLTVREEEREGGVYFKNGQIQHAEYLGIEGKDALLLMFHLRKGYFFFQPDKVPLKQTLAGTATELLLDGLRQMDEAKRAVREFRSRRSSRGILTPEDSSDGDGGD